MPPYKRLVVFASGNGSNAEAIIRFFKQGQVARVVKVYSNKADAYVLTRAKQLGVSTQVLSKKSFTENTTVFLDTLKDLNPDYIVLAGFLLKIPELIVEAFPNKIINIHPALLPKYGGKGMYGMHVHEAVCKAQEKHSGITIHFVNEAYDEGAIIFQAKIPLEKGETPDSLASKIHALEHMHYPKVIAKLLETTP